MVLAEITEEGFLDGKPGTSFHVAQQAAGTFHSLQIPILPPTAVCVVRSGPGQWSVGKEFASHLRIPAHWKTNLLRRAALFLAPETLFLFDSAENISLLYYRN